MWLNANQISLKKEKTKLVIFKHQRKKLDNEIEIELNKKYFYPSQSNKYLGINTDQNLNWKRHINNIAVKLKRANDLQFKIRNFVNITISITTYSTIFDFHIKVNRSVYIA